MSYFYEKIPLLNQSTYIIRSFEVPVMDFPLHYHPEYELTLTLNTNGKRIVGDSIESFDDADLVLIGPGLPHQWKTNWEKNTGQNSVQIILQVHPEFMQGEIAVRKELESLGILLRNACRGIHFGPETTQKVLAMLKNLQQFNEGFKGFVHLLEVFELLSVAQDSRLLASGGYRNQSQESKPDAINSLFAYLFAHFKEDLHLEGIAKHFNMSASNLSHYLKKKTGKTFSILLAELRIGHASRLMVEDNYSISSAAFESGFNNLSYFNRKFKDIKGLTPKEYKINFKKLK